MPSARVESAAILVVDDVDTPSLFRRKRVRLSTSDRRPGLPHGLAGGDDQPRRTVRRAAGGGFVRVGGTPGGGTSGTHNLTGRGAMVSSLVLQLRRAISTKRTVLRSFVTVGALVAAVSGAERVAAQTTFARQSADALKPG